MNKQKFQRYDLVHINKDLGRNMSHFESDVDAIVLYSYKDDYKKKDSEEKYGLYIKGHGEITWYYPEQLVLIKPNQKEKLHEFQDEMNRKQAQIYDDYLAGKLFRLKF